MTHQIQKYISTALEKLGVEAVEEIHLEHPADAQHGDWSTNIAMVLFGQRKAPSEFTQPRQFAQAIAEQLQEQSGGAFAQVNVAGPGFINFTLAHSFFIQEAQKIVQSGKENTSSVLKKKKIIVEFTDPNPFKEFHIGHLYSNTVGEAISRLLSNSGAEVQRVCYQGDVGMHVAKSIWGLRQKMAVEKTSLSDLRALDLPEKIKFLGQAYAIGSTVFEEDEAAKKEMQDINYMCFVSAQDFLQETANWQPQVDYQQYIQDTSLDYAEIKELYQEGRAWSLAYFNTVYARLGMKFDDFYFESLVGEYGIQIVREFLPKGVFEESQGAIIFPGSKYGLHDRVFVNSLGLPTYECKELGLAPEKYRRFAYDQSIIITGNEIDEYFKVLLKALEQVRPELAAKTRHFSHGMVRLPEGKMSSRTGNVLTGEWLIEEAKQKILAIFEQTKSELIGQEREETAEKVALGAIKYALLKHHLGANIAFSFDESLSFQGNSGPYLQYTAARCFSVLRKAKESGVQNQVSATLSGYQLNTEEIAVFRQLYQFQEVINEAAAEFAPHRLCTYLFDLAQTFNAFYNKHSILSGENSVEREVRLLLTQSVLTVLQKGLDLLNIRTVEKM
jgi:arginyl-tRNA synthetase